LSWPAGNGTAADRDELVGCRQSTQPRPTDFACRRFARCCSGPPCLEQSRLGGPDHQEGLPISCRPWRLERAFPDHVMVSDDQPPGRFAAERIWGSRSICSDRMVLADRSSGDTTRASRSSWLRWTRRVHHAVGPHHTSPTEIFLTPHWDVFVPYTPRIPFYIFSSSMST
jgi:hypothetical protein